MKNNVGKFLTRKLLLFAFASMSTVKTLQTAVRCEQNRMSSTQSEFDRLFSESPEQNSINCLFTFKYEKRKLASIKYCFKIRPTY